MRMKRVSAGPVARLSFGSQPSARRKKRPLRVPEAGDCRWGVKSNAKKWSRSSSIRPNSRTSSKRSVTLS